MSVILFGHIVSVGHHKNILLVDNQGKQGSTYEHRDMKSSVSLLKKKKKKGMQEIFRHVTLSSNFAKEEAFSAYLTLKITTRAGFETSA